MNFNQPTRQAKIGIIANFLYSSQKFIRAFAPIIAIYFFKKASFSFFDLLWWIIPIVILILLWAVLRYYNLYFYINQSTQSFVIDSGVINKSKVTIQLEKIQQVNINQTFINKLVNVYSIEIDSAGSKDKEVLINSVSYEVAQELKKTLLNYSKENKVVSAEEEKKETVESARKIRKISFLSLVKVGLTSSYLRTFALIFAFVITIYDNINKYIGKEFVDDEMVENFVQEQFTLIIIPFLLLFIIVLVLMVNLFNTIVKFFNFQILIENNTLLLSYGLLNTRNTIIRPKRVQIVSVIQNYFQRKLGINSVKIQQVTGSESFDKKTALEIPGCSPSEKDDFLKMVYGELPPKPNVVLRPNYRFFVFRFFIFGLIPAIAAIGLFFYMEQDDLSVLLSSVFAYLTLVGFVVYRIFMVRKMEVSDRFIKITSGFWDITETIVEPNKIQKLTISQYFWQTKTNIGTLNLSTAGGALSFETTNYHHIEELMDVFMYQVESSNEGWM